MTTSTCCGHTRARDACGSSISRHKARSGGFGTSARMNSRPYPPARNAGNGASRQFSSSHYRSRRLAAYPTLNPDIANDQLDSASLPHFASTRISFSTTLTGQGDRADQPPGSGSARHSFKDSDSSTSADHRTRQVRQEVFGTWALPDWTLSKGAPGLGICCQACPG